MPRSHSILTELVVAEVTDYALRFETSLPPDARGAPCFNDRDELVAIVVDPAGPLASGVLAAAIGRNLDDEDDLPVFA